MDTENKYYPDAPPVPEPEPKPTTPAEPKKPRRTPKEVLTGEVEILELKQRKALLLNDIARIEDLPKREAEQNARDFAQDQRDIEQEDRMIALDSRAEVYGRDETALKRKRKEDSDWVVEQREQILIKAQANGNLYKRLVKAAKELDKREERLETELAKAVEDNKHATEARWKEWNKARTERQDNIEFRNAVGMTEKEAKKFMAMGNKQRTLYLKATARTVFKLKEEED